MTIAEDSSTNEGEIATGREGGVVEMQRDSDWQSEESPVACATDGPTPNVPS